MLRIVLGFRSGAREEDPAVVYCGHSGAKAQAAIDEAKNFVRLETAEIPVTRRAKRSQAVLLHAHAEARRRADKKREKLQASRASELTPFLLEGATLPENLHDLSAEEFEALLSTVKAAFSENEEAFKAEKLRREKLQNARHKALSVYVRQIPVGLWMLTEEEFADALEAAVQKDIDSSALYAARSAELGAFLPEGAELPDDLAEMSAEKFGRMLVKVKDKHTAASKTQSPQPEQ